MNRVYLAGRITEDNLLWAFSWRLYLSDKLIEIGLNPVNPMRDIVKLTTPQSPLQTTMAVRNTDVTWHYIFERDMDDIVHSDFIIVNLDKMGGAIGTYVEIGYAYGRCMNIFAFGGTPEVRNHPFIQNTITQFFEDEYKLLTFLKENNY